MLTVRVEVEVPPEVRTRLDGLVEADRLTDDVVVVNVIVPENPPRLVIVTVELPLAPRERHVELDELPDVRVTLDPHDALRPVDGVTVVVIVIVPA